ncbi:Mitochondrial import receptor subunit TOM22 [Ranunculus cassubicifolius]
MASSRNRSNEGVLARVSSSVSQSSVVNKGKEIASSAVYMGKRLYQSTGKATWYLGTTVLILVVPLIIVMDREQQLLEMEEHSSALLGTSTAN